MMIVLNPPRDGKTGGWSEARERSTTRRLGFAAIRKLSKDLPPLRAGGISGRHIEIPKAPPDPPPL